MKSIKKALTVALITIAACAPFLTGYYLKVRQTNYSCDSEIYARNADEHYNLIMNYHFSNGSGNYHAIGLTTFNDGTIIPMDRNLTFRYTFVDDVLTLVSQNNDDNPEDLNNPTTLVPDFFRFSGRGLTIRSKRESNMGYLIILGNTPIFYCKRTAR
jgi:hypothetical protein